MLIDVYSNNDVLKRVSEIMAKDNFEALIGDAEFASPRRPNQPLRRYRSKSFSPIYN
jgi:hypothetical protein